MPNEPAPKIAIIGSGPSGCYLAQFLQRSTPGADITIFDRLASPYGLIRYGVAADHQHTKQITRQFDRLFASPNVRFAGNVDIGTDISLAQLKESYDVVVAATGLTLDKKLGVEGDGLEGVYGSGYLTRVLNTHPGEEPHWPDLGDDVVIVGAGNVALDLLRFLVKGEADYEGSDISEDALARYLGSPAKRITLISRSAVANSKGDAQMIKELATLERASYKTTASLETAEDLERTAAARVAAVQMLVAADRPSYQGPEVELIFGATPTRVLGESSVTGIEVADAHGNKRIIEAGAVITAIGFESHPAESLHEIVREQAETGRTADGIYRTGWARRGPIGAIPENRACAKLVADEITEDLTNGLLSADANKLGFDALPENVQEKSLAFENWQKLDEHERESAVPGRVRRKIRDHQGMVEISRK